MAKAEVDNGPNPRVIRALQRLAERLQTDVQEALDAAKVRRLAPFESVLRCCEYIQARYVAPVQGRALPTQLLRKPTGLRVGADLVAGLKAIESHLLNACVRQLQHVIEVFRPFDGKPFGRKTIGRTGGKVSKQNSVSEEEKALERLEQAGVDIIQLFRTTIESLMAQAPVVDKKRTSKTDDKTSRILTPPQLALEMGVHVDKIYAWIRSGELRATNTAVKRGGRARFRISREDAEDFQRRRQNLPPPPRSPRRKKKDFGAAAYY
ncbi:MAG: helix-turn-helix domain-containing protein [Thermoguttaceae bacterium]|jgi:excisionase family DNA binding protein